MSLEHLNPRQLYLTGPLSESRINHSIPISLNPESWPLSPEPYTHVDRIVIRRQDEVIKAKHANELKKSSITKQYVDTLKLPKRTALGGHGGQKWCERIKVMLTFSSRPYHPAMTPRHNSSNSLPCCCYPRANLIEAGLILPINLRSDLAAVVHVLT